VPPDFASVTWHEPGAEDVPAALLELPDGSPAPGDAALVRAARDVVEAVGRRSVGTDG
jgi:uncharacterized protein (DUF849 family)